MPRPKATFETSMGNFEVELYVDQMPITASNFIDLALTGFYDGLHFHRVVRDFVVQFGCPMSLDPKNKKAGSGGPKGKTEFELLGGQDKGTFLKRDQKGNITDELIEKMSNEKGTLSMANSGKENSGGSQFFINLNHNSKLDWFDKSSNDAHPVFGKVTSGMEVVEAMGQVEVNAMEMPKEGIKVIKVTIAGVSAQKFQN